MLHDRTSHNALFVTQASIAESLGVRRGQINLAATPGP